ncbi:MAG: WYL domain-containing protein, partial [Ruminococcus sp.]|nr:WYL domain-containing protein [Ruminococcus sp.]
MEHERIIHIYEYLSRNTDEDREVTVKDIRNYLEGTTNLGYVSVLTIRRDLERLSNMGYDILTRKGAHNTTYYSLFGKGFSFNEIRFLVDSISINKFLTAEQKQKLIKKFEGMCSESEVRQLISRISLNGRGAPSLDLLANLEKVHNIISAHQKIDFEYGKFNTQKKMVYYSKKRDMIPVKVIYFEERFYLKCMNTETLQIRTYRIDRMIN